MVLLKGISILVISFVILSLGMYISNLANRKIREGFNSCANKKAKINNWTLESGGMLKPNEYLVAENKQYFFIVQGDGNSVVYRGSGPSDNQGAIWTSNTNNKGNVTLNFQRDNNLVIYDSNNKPAWASGSGGKRNKDGYVFVNDRYCLQPLKKFEDGDCYQDRSSRDLQTLLGRFDNIDSCKLEARRRGLNYIGIQYGNNSAKAECWGGNNPGSYGKSNNCNMKIQNGTSWGGPWANQIYKSGLNSSDSNEPPATRRWSSADYTRHMVGSANKKENCKKICNDLGDDCVTMALGDGNQNGKAYNCTTYKGCELSPEGSSTSWTRGSGNTGGQYEFFKKEKAKLMFMGGTLGPKSKLIMQNDGNLVIYDNNGKALWSSKGGLVTPPPPFEEYIAEQAYNPCPQTMPYPLEYPYKGAAKEEKGAWFCYKEDRTNPSDQIKSHNYPVCSYKGPAPTPNGEGKWGTNQKDCWPELNSDGAYISYDNKTLKKSQEGNPPKWFKDKVGCMPTDSVEAAKKICNGYQECGGFFKYKQGTAGDKQDGTTRTCFKWKGGEKVQGPNDLNNSIGVYAGDTYLKTEPVEGVKCNSFNNWRKNWGGNSVETKVSDELPYGSKVDGWGSCLAYCKQNPECKQTVYNKRTKACYPMKKAMSDDQDNKGGKNYDWISAHCTSTSQFKRSSVVFANQKVKIGESYLESVEPQSENTNPQASSMMNSISNLFSMGDVASSNTLAPLDAPIESPIETPIESPIGENSEVITSQSQVNNINPLVVFKNVENKMKDKMPNFDSKIISEVMINQMNNNPSITLENVSYLPIDNNQYNRIGSAYMQSSLNQINNKTTSTENISMGKTIVKIYITKIKEEIGIISSSYNITDHAYSLLEEKMNNTFYNQNQNNVNDETGDLSTIDVRLHPQIKEQQQLQRKIQQQNSLKENEMKQTISSQGYNSLFGNSDSVYKPFNSILNLFK